MYTKTSCQDCGLGVGAYSLHLTVCELYLVYSPL
jgi:hypothetical protein